MHVPAPLVQLVVEAFLAKAIERPASVYRQTYGAPGRLRQSHFYCTNVGTVPAIDFLKTAGLDEVSGLRVRLAPSGKRKSEAIAPAFTVTLALLVMLSVWPTRYIIPDIVIVVCEMVLLPAFPAFLLFVAEG